ncbi:MAG: glycine dehydrogenase (aminomethyl-transferring), partial [Verrucomicrobiia bacterium]
MKMLHDFSAATSTLDLNADFSRRHIGPPAEEIEVMLSMLGMKSLDDLTASIVPPTIRYNGDLRIPAAASEEAALEELARKLEANQPRKSFLGMGYYECHVPGVIRRNILENPGWYTSYTPYQAEVSQGRLEAMLNFQTLVSELTGLEVANASLLDEGTAAAEAMGMAFSLRRNESVKRFVVSDTCHPQTKTVLVT